MTREAFTDGAATATRVCASPATQAPSRHRAACVTRRECIDRSACGSARNERRLVPARLSQSHPSSSVVVGQRQRRLSRRRRRSSRIEHERRSAESHQRQQQRRPSHQCAQAPYRGAQVTSSAQLSISLTFVPSIKDGTIDIEQLRTKAAGALWPAKTCASEKTASVLFTVHQPLPDP